MEAKIITIEKAEGIKTAEEKISIPTKSMKTRTNKTKENVPKQKPKDSPEKMLKRN